MKNETETSKIALDAIRSYFSPIKVAYKALVLPDKELDRWAWGKAWWSTGVTVLTIIVSIALLTLILEYIPDRLRWATIGFIGALDIVILYLLMGYNRLEIELKALEGIHQDVLGALTPDTAKILMLKWNEELEDARKKRGKK